MRNVIKVLKTLGSNLSFDRSRNYLKEWHEIWPITISFLICVFEATVDLVISSHSQLNQPASDLLDRFLYRWFEVFSISKQCYPVPRRCWWVYQTMLLWFSISKIPKYVYQLSDSNYYVVWYALCMIQTKKLVFFKWNVKLLVYGLIFKYIYRYTLFVWF